MKTKFATLAEVKTQYTETQILEMVEKYLDNKEYRRKYNHTKNEVFKAWKASQK